MNTKTFYDIEQQDFITEQQLYSEYLDAMHDGTHDYCEFWEYVNNCLTIHNGTLEIV